MAIGLAFAPSSVTVGDAPPPWAPSDIAGLKVWVEADGIGGSDGDPVGTWTDQSGQGNNLTQGTAGKRPTLKLSIVNGEPVVRFASASSQTLATVAFGVALAQPNTIFIVGKTTGTTAAQVFCDGIAGGARHSIRRVESGATDSWGLYGGTAEINTGGFSADTNFHVFEAIVNGASSSLLIDGTSRASGSIGTNSLGGLRLGAQMDDGGQHLNGDIAAVFVYNANVSSGDRSDLRNYCGDKYGITVV